MSPNGARSHRESMFDSVGHIISETMAEFGGLPADLLSPSMAFTAINESFAARGLQAQQSRQGRVEQVISLAPTSRDMALPPQVVMPLWLEMKIANPPYTTWRYIPWVNQPLIEESRERSDLRCSFYRNAQTRFWHLTLSYDPVSAAHQLWHAPDPLLVSSDRDTVPIEKSFATMFKWDAVVNLVPKILMRAANLPEDRQLNSGQITALTATVQHAQAELRDKWSDLWVARNHQSKEQRGRARRSIIAKNSFPTARRTY